MNIPTPTGQACPACGSNDVADLFRADRLPAHCNVLCPTREAALRVPRVTVRLVFCGTCSHIFNSDFKSELMEYGRNYENALDYSPTFQSYLRSEAVRLVRDYGLYNKSIVEIGCGNGEFLKTLCKLGASRGLGFDKSATGTSAEESVTFVQDSYSEVYSDCHGDLFCCRQTLEHMEKPAEFLSMLHRVISGGTNTVVFFEVPNGSYMVREACIWDVIHEHFSYYCANSLRQAFVRSGYDVVAIRETYGGQFLCIDAKPSSNENRLQYSPCEAIETSAFQKFAEAYNVRIRDWRKRLEEFSAKGLRAVVWGAGSKGITFLNMLNANGGVEYVVDVNPRKKGMHVPGTGHPIFAPESVLRQLPPHVVIVMNSIYTEEIRRTLSSLGLRPEIMVA